MQEQAMTSSADSYDPAVPQMAAIGQYHTVAVGLTPQATASKKLSELPPPKYKSSHAHMEVAKAFAEIYRGIYPYMSVKTRDMLKDYILREPIEYQAIGRSRSKCAYEIAKRIVDKHYLGDEKQGLLLPQETSDTLAAELLPDRHKIVAALRPNKNKTGDFDDTDKRAEVDILRMQLRAIPPLSTFVNDEGVIKPDEFDQWVTEASSFVHRQR